MKGKIRNDTKGVPKYRVSGGKDRQVWPSSGQGGIGGHFLPRSWSAAFVDPKYANGLNESAPDDIYLIVRFTR
jgi:hypothetical protein